MAREVSSDPTEYSDAFLGVWLCVLAPLCCVAHTVAAASMTDK